MVRQIGLERLGAPRCTRLRCIWVRHPSQYGDQRRETYARMVSLDANLDAISRYSPDTRRLLLLIRSQVHIINEKVDLVTELMRMTFDPSIGDDNPRRVRSNLRAAYSDICQRAHHTADLIGELQLPT